MCISSVDVEYRTGNKAGAVLWGRARREREAGVDGDPKLSMEIRVVLDYLPDGLIPSNSFCDSGINVLPPLGDRVVTLHLLSAGCRESQWKRGWFELGGLERRRVAGNQHGSLGFIGVKDAEVDAYITRLTSEGAPNRNQPCTGSIVLKQANAAECYSHPGGRVTHRTLYSHVGPSSR